MPELLSKNLLALLILIFSLSCSSFAQDSLRVELVEKYTYSFSIVQGKLAGQGWDSLKTGMQRSQFVLLGENHSSPKLSELMAVLLKEMKPLGYGHLLIETGPLASQKLKSLHDDKKNNFGNSLSTFLTRYRFDDSPPAEFIAMKKDVPMYAAAFENGYSVQGIDREYYTATRYILDDLGEYCKTESLKNLHARALEKLKNYQAEELKEEKGNNHILKCQTDADIQNFLNQVSAVNPVAAYKVKELRKSHEVYGLYGRKQFRKSEAVRLANMKKNLGDYFYSNIQKGKSTKAIIKLGNMHTGTGESWLGFFDIGNTVSQLAALEGTRSLHIHNMRRFRLNDKGETMDFLNDGYEQYTNLVTQADLTSWRLIHLVPLREMMLTGKLVANKEERFIIMNNDWVLLTPLDESYSGSFNYTD